MKAELDLNELDFNDPAVGAFCEEEGCSFTVWAPEKETVEVVLNDGSAYEMQPQNNGYWNVILKEVKPGDTYQFRLNGNKLLPDPASRHQPESVHGPSAVVDSNFDWTDQNWKGLALNKMVIYELHVGTFTDAGTFEGVKSKLPYLKELGVNAIEILPVAQFPGGRNWGYDGVYPFAAQNTYGGPEGLKSLVDEAHRCGIAVILDVVYNHQGPEGNYLSEFGPYFTDKYNSFWGSAMNFDDAHSDGVRHFYLQNALMWLNEFHIDGLRLDAVHAIWDSGAKHFMELLSEKVNELETETGVPKTLIAEIDLNNPRYINPKSQGGFGLHGQWIDEFHHALHAVVTGESDGYYEDFGTMQHLAKTLRDSYVYTGQYSKHRKKRFGVMPQTNTYGQFVVFAQNHDQIGNRFMGDRISTQISFEALKLTAATYLLAPQVPMLFMGEEYGEKNPFQYFISHTDKDLVEAVRQGRKKEFAHFNWEGEAPDPQSEDTFRQCILSWNQEEDENSKALLEYYRFLIRFRKERTAMQGQDRTAIKVHQPEEDKKVISFERKHGGYQLLVILNFGKEKAVWNGARPGGLNKVFDSSSKTWNGPGDSSASTDTIVLNPESAVIFEII